VSRVSGTIPLLPPYTFLAKGQGQLQYLSINRMHRSYFVKFSDRMFPYN
jgi:hypothetical protein